jgi:hypothetical protein
MALYHLNTTGSEERLLLTDTSVPGLDSQKNFVIKMKFNMRFNLRPDELGYDVEKLGIRADEKYLLLHYELATNYPHFSTIRLVESSLDLFSKTLQMRRIFTLCSNSPSATERRCNRLTTLSDNIVMNNTRISTMDQPQKYNTTSSFTRDIPDKFSGSGSGGGGGGSSKDLDQINNNANTQALEDEISNVRLFHVYFYREASSRDLYGEYLALSIEPKVCLPGAA